MLAIRRWPSTAHPAVRGCKDVRGVVTVRMIFVNLPVRDVAASRAFFAALGFGFNEDVSDETTAFMIVEENIGVLLLEQQRFKDFLTGELSDANKATEVVLCLSAASRREVDETVARAIEAGGRPWKPPFTDGEMYGGSFQDIDGHVWEVMTVDLPAPATAADGGSAPALDGT